MTIKEVFKTIMDEQEEIALATSVAEQPNVRIVNFFYDDNKKCLFFSTFKGNNKIAEFNANAKVAFTTIPTNGTKHIRVQHGLIKKSDLTVYDVAEQWIQKIPSYAENIEQAGAMLVLYEIHFTEAVVTLSMDTIETLIL
ncbi:pyridoxamine 5'-phosphate oxidase family protein [Erwinia sp. CPCC 100877]|nr:pyridoxamine 5'-phosphate oxidase family protein [Erwinia sp. CPCC 100877]